MAPTNSIIEILKEQQFEPDKLKIWGRGVNQDVFYPRDPNPVKYPRKEGRPIFMYVGRVSAEKGIEDFLKLSLNATKYIVGDGPLLPVLKKKYPDAHFIGYLTGDALAEAYSNANVVVFPSKTDTFGNVITEALSTGTPVAAFPAPGPVDIIRPNPKVGAVNENLGVAVAQAYANGDPEECVRYVAEHFTWEKATSQFLDNLVPTRDSDGGDVVLVNHHFLLMEFFLWVLAITVIYLFLRICCVGPFARHYVRLLFVSLKVRWNSSVADKMSIHDDLLPRKRKMSEPQDEEMMRWLKEESFNDDSERI